MVQTTEVLTDLRQNLLFGASSNSDLTWTAPMFGGGTISFGLFGLFEESEWGPDAALKFLKRE